MLVAEPGRVRTPLLLLLNAHEAPRRFELPPGLWRPRLDSTTPDGAPREVPGADAAWLVGHCEVGAHAVVLLQRVQA